MPNFPEQISFTKTWHSKPYPFVSPTRAELSAAGKNVIVTGGGTGIGLATAIADEVGKLDVLVSNAGALPPFGPIVKYKVEDLMRGFEGNVIGAFNAFQLFLPLAGPNPFILSISTCLVNITPVPMTSAYAITKAAALKMMEYLGAENPHLR